jgi:Amt family ammonium transporter
MKRFLVNTAALMTGAVLLAAPAFAAAPAAEVAEVVAEVAQAAPAVPNPGNNGFMMTATVLVLLMILPGLALFYGGLTRSKNMLSTMTQIGAAASLAMLVWVMWGYGLAFGPEGNEWISWGKFFLAGVTPDSTAATFTDEVISEYIFISFQMTFAAITAALVLGSVVERMKFSATMVFTLVWLTIVYFPIAHMVWEARGFFFAMGALDFAGGTVVHINAGISALVAAFILGKRRGYPNEPMPPHSLTLTMVGTGLLWVGWFGFNAGSALEANGSAALAMINTFVATAAAALAWLLVEWGAKGKPSLLGTVSGVVAGLVAVTPAAGLVGPMGAIVLGVLGGAIAFFFCTTVKNALGYDDSLDVFGIHAVAGIVGSIGTGIFVSTSLGGVGAPDYAMAAQVWKQFVAVVIAIVWCGVVSFILFKIVDVIVGLRVTADREREGLDLAEHGERAYNL